MLRHDNQFFAFAIAAATLAALSLATPAMAGDGNTLYIQQDASSTDGNSLFVDQSLAFDSTVAGDIAATLPAMQTGGNNTGVITLSGDGAMVLFGQTNSGLGAGTNTAEITGDSYATIVLQQDGFGNDGMLDVGSGSNQGALFQYGDENTGKVTVSGTNNSGTLYQRGDNNTYALNVTGNKSSVQWNQIGNNISPTSSVTPATVISNAGKVIITQTSY
ncbi:hypothetical protein U5922_001865 [Aquicoccus sp. G2-2]|uniref:hypothetical protein n=1 Tax=Aquicoccus sp. G2-2 TaxID=3092120 RepID=UPI002ADF3008|nr:hypothetical protein [Aquicoccus sp. G2-2]MEA1112274.1 hypothetical protein [Aquicoccus sp. G2-2]